MKIALKNCRWERQKCVSRDSSAAATVIDPLGLLLALTGTENLDDIPATYCEMSRSVTPNTCKRRRRSSSISSRSRSRASSLVGSSPRAKRSSFHWGIGGVRLSVAVLS